MSSIEARAQSIKIEIDLGHRTEIIELRDVQFSLDLTAEVGEKMTETMFCEFEPTGYVDLKLSAYGRRNRP